MFVVARSGSRLGDLIASDWTTERFCESMELEVSEFSIIPTREDDHVSAPDVHQLEAALPVTEDHDDLGPTWPARNSTDWRSGGHP